jgi:hypothetical protein
LKVWGARDRNFLVLALVRPAAALNLLALFGALACGGAEGGAPPGQTGVAGSGSSSAGQPASAGASGAPAGAGATAGGTAGASPGVGGAGASGSAGSSAGGAAGETQTGAAGTGGVAPTDPNQRKLLLRDEGISTLHYVDLAQPANKWSAVVPAGRDLQLVGNRRALIGTASGYQERSLDDGGMLKEVTGFPGTVAAYRLRSGNTLLSGVDFNGGDGIVLVELDAAGAVARQIEYPGFDYVRLVRETQNGHFLVTAETRVFEGDAQGNVVWEVTVQGHAEPHAWKALRLATGDVVVAGGYAASLQVFGPDEMLKKTITGGTDVKPFFFSDVQVLPDGHFVVTNWQGHGTGLGAMGRQLIEYDPAGALVWSWQQDASFVSSLQHAIVLDGLDVTKLHVENPQTGVLEAAN